VKVQYGPPGVAESLDDLVDLGARLIDEPSICACVDDIDGHHFLQGPQH
jgi:hypothetical protein